MRVMCAVVMLTALWHTGLSAQETVAEVIRLQRTVVAMQARIDSLETLLSRSGSVLSASPGTASSAAVISSPWDRLVTLEEVGYGDPQVLMSSVPHWLTTGWSADIGDRVRLYTETWHDRTLRAVRRYRTLLPGMEASFRRHGVPAELCALCIVESAADSHAVSRAGAVGLWQIMEGTGRSMGMAIGPDRDDRLDVSLSTDVAARYLSRAYQILGDWRLAVMSYNCGVGAVQKALRSAGGRTDWRSVARFLPQETREYLPSLMGVLCFLELERGDVR